MAFTEKSIEKFIADRWAYSEDETIPVNAKDLAEVLLLLQKTQRSLKSSMERIAIFEATRKSEFTVNLRGLYA